VLEQVKHKFAIEAAEDFDREHKPVHVPDYIPPQMSSEIAKLGKKGRAK
jgi:hypothetical protein